MGDRRRIFDLLDGDACCLQRGDRRLTSGPRPLDANLDFLDPVLRSLLSRLLSGHLTSKRRALPRALETTRASTCPTNRITLGVGDRYLGIVERRLNERDCRRNITSNLAPLVSRVLFVLLLFRHDILFYLTC